MQFNYFEYIFATYLGSEGRISPSSLYFSENNKRGHKIGMWPSDTIIRKESAIYHIFIDLNYPWFDDKGQTS